MSSPPPLHGTARLRHFVQQLAVLVEQRLPEPETLAQGRALLAALVAHDDWLPAAYAQPHPERYQQYLLHADALGRFAYAVLVVEFAAQLATLGLKRGLAEAMAPTR